MKKIVVGFLSVVVVLLLISSFAQAGLKMSVNAGYYSPNYGQINEELSAAKVETGMDLRFDSGVFFGLSIAGEVGDKLEVRLEYDSFSSKTKDSYSYSDTFEGITYREDITVELELSTTPIILSLIYNFSPGASLSPYAGVGLGIFSSKLSSKTVCKYYENGELVDVEPPYEYSDDDSPMGFLVLAGVQKDVTENLIFRGEVRYISAKATFATEVESVDCDLSGFMGSVGLEYRF